MPRINQGIFREIRDEIKKLKIYFRDEVKGYFDCSDLNEIYSNPEYYWNPGNDFFSDFAYSADEIYSKAKKLEITIENLLKTTKFEIESKKNEYEGMLSEITQLREKIVFLFSTILDLYATRSINRIEQATLNKFSIYHDLKM